MNFSKSAIEVEKKPFFRKGNKRKGDLGKSLLLDLELITMMNKKLHNKVPLVGPFSAVPTKLYCHRKNSFPK